MPSPAFTRRALQLSVLIAIALSAVCLRVVLSARDELAQAEHALQLHDRDAAIVHLRRAARWYAPCSPYHVRALERLGELAQAAERAGDSERALSAYRAVRGAILATRGLYVPQRERLQAANQRIAALMSRLPAPGSDAGKSPEQLYAEHLALLSPIPGPDVFWSVVLLVGFLCWVCSAFAFSIRAIDEQDRWVGVEVRRWAGLIALGFGLFVLGMSLV